MLTKEEIISRLPREIKHHYKAFENNRNDKRDLPPHLPGVDIATEIEKDKRERTKDLPKGPLCQVYDQLIIIIGYEPGRLFREIEVLANIHYKDV